MRQLATIRVIDAIEPIEGADRIEKAIVGGWNVVVGKGLHKAGDQVIFCEIDSAIPVADKRLDHDGSLAKRGTKTIDGAEYHVLKTVKLRKVVSQGLILPLSVLSPLQRLRNYFGLLSPDVTETLGILKWDPWNKEQKSQKKSFPTDPNIIGPFPADVARKSDSERIQNLGKYWHGLRDMEWVVTEKIDGQSVTLIRDNGRTRVASRNYEVKNHAAKDWAVKEGFEHLVQDGFAVQGEWAGPGVQGNRLGLKENQFFVFDVFNEGEPVPIPNWPQWAWDRRVPVLHKVRTRLEAIPEMIEKWDGMKSVVAPSRLAEGVVYRTADDNALPQLGQRPNFKVISNKYLLKEK